MKRSAMAWLIPCGVALFFMALYGLTAQRGVSWQDSGLYQMRVLTGDLRFVFGLALAHPLYIWMGQHLVHGVAPEQAFFALNWMSGIGMAVALGVLASVVLRATKQIWAAVVAALLLGFSQMGWWLSTIAEVYTWSLAFLFVEIAIVLHICSVPQQRAGRYWLLLALVNGLHASLHNVALLHLPIYAALYLAANRAASLRKHGVMGVCGAACWLLGAGVLVQLFWREWQVTHDLAATVRSWLFGYSFEQVVLGSGNRVSFQMTLMNWALAGVSLLNPCWLFIAWSRKPALVPRFKGVLLALTLVHALFWVRYFVPDQATFVLPTLGLLAVWAGLGYASRTWTIRTHLLVCALILTCGVGVPLAGAWVLEQTQWVHRSRTLPFREEARYWLIPWKQQEDSAARFAAAVAERVRDGDIVFADNTAAGPLVASQALGKLPAGVRWVTDYTGESVAQQQALMREKARVFVVSPVPGYAPHAMLKEHHFEPDGVLYRVR